MLKDTRFKIHLAGAGSACRSGLRFKTLLIPSPPTPHPAALLIGSLPSTTPPHSRSFQAATWARLTPAPLRLTPLLLLTPTARPQYPAPFRCTGAATWARWTSPVPCSSLQFLLALSHHLLSPPASLFRPRLRKRWTSSAPSSPRSYSPYRSLLLPSLTPRRSITAATWARSTCPACSYVSGPLALAPFYPPPAPSIPL